VAGVVDRLEARALLQRHASTTDRRVRQLLLTPEGEALRAQVEPAMRRAQQRILAPLPRAERAEFLRLLRVLVDGNNEASRAPAVSITKGSDKASAYIAHRASCCSAGGTRSNCCTSAGAAAASAPFSLLRP
jgi:hypothetical protein